MNYSKLLFLLTSEKLLCSDAYLHWSAYIITLWITPKLAVAVNFAQLVALANHSKLSL